MIGLILAAIGIGIAGYGMMKQKEAAQNAQAAQAQITAASQRAEALRAEQMRLESARQQREVVRQSIISRSNMLSGAVSSGVKESSGLSGGLAGIVSQTGQRLTALSENLNIGEGLFQTAQQRLGADMSLNQARTSQQEGQGLFQLGTSLAMNSKGIGQTAESVPSLFSSGGGGNPYRSSWNTTVTYNA